LWSQGDYDGLIRRLDNITTKLNLLLTQESNMAVDVAALTAEVTRNSDVTQSIVQLVKNLADQLAAIPPSSDPTTQAALDALKATLSTNDDAIAAAVVQNTPAAP
jgi:small-conductance mechanosensitive channel